MGGRGASSGISIYGNKYGTQYRSVLTVGNMKFVTKTDNNTKESLMETMTKGRVYVEFGGEDLLRIVYFDTENKRNKQIDLRHQHKGMQPHVHHGYLHNENDGIKGGTMPTDKEKKLIDKAIRTWDNAKKQGLV